MKITICKWAKHNPRKDYKSMPWFKCSSRMYHDPKIKPLPIETKWLWVCLLCIAAEENNQGVIECDIAYLADEAKVSQQNVVDGLAVLKTKYLIEFNNSSITNVTISSDERCPDESRHLHRERREENEENEEKDHAAAKAALPKRAKALQFDEDDLKAATWFRDEHKKANPHARALDRVNLDVWANEVRLLREAGPFTHGEIAAVMRFVIDSDFWRPNVQSTAKLRKKWDALTAQLLADRHKAYLKSRPKPIGADGGF